MKPPNVDQAIIGDAKVRDYLLSPTHPIGQFKAEVFARAGYAADDWRRLAEDLRRHALEFDVRSEMRSEYGQMFSVVGDIEGPSGRKIRTRVVWIIR